MQEGAHVVGYAVITRIDNPLLQAEKPEAFVYAALTHDLGKAISTTRGEDGEWHANGHENTGVPLARAMLGRLGAGKEIIAYCENMCRLHMRPHV